MSKPTESPQEATVKDTPVPTNASGHDTLPVNSTSEDAAGNNSTNVEAPSTESTGNAPPTNPPIKDTAPTNPSSTSQKHKRSPSPEADNTISALETTYNARTKDLDKARNRLEHHGRRWRDRNKEDEEEGALALERLRAAVDVAEAMREKAHRYLVGADSERKAKRQRREETEGLLGESLALLRG